MFLCTLLNLNEVQLCRLQKLYKTPRQIGSSLKNFATTVCFFGYSFYLRYINIVNPIRNTYEYPFCKPSCTPQFP